MNEKFKKYELFVCLLFVFNCILTFFLEYWYILIFSSLCIIIFTVMAIWSLSFSKIKKALFIFAQLICCLIIYAIWFVIWFFMFSDGISFGE